MGLLKGSKRPPRSEEWRRNLSLSLKGRIPTFLGKHHTEETKQKISKARIGFRASIETCRKISEGHKGIKGYWTGKHFSLETRRKISESNLKNPTRYWLGKKMPLEMRLKLGKSRLGSHRSLETRLKMSRIQIGRKRTLETRKKISGKNHWRWKGGITPENHKIRGSLEMKLWKESCMIRDNYTDAKTGIRGGKLIVHHIQNFADYPELRTSIDNGITLSIKSHKEFHHIYGVRHNTRAQLEEFLGRKLSST